MRSDDRTGLMTLPSALPEEAQEHVKQVLHDMLSSAPFRTSRQCQDLLRYIVLHSLSGEDESLRERIIGIEVFGRKPDYDQAADPVVRIRAAEVRKRLALYYGESSEAGRHLKISIPSGSYRASFDFFDRGEEVRQPVPAFPRDAVNGTIDQVRPIPELEVKPPVPAETGVRDYLRRRQVYGLLLLAVLLIPAIYGVVQWKHETPFERFWAPFLKDPNHSFLYVGSNAVYQLSPAFIDKYRQEHRLDKIERMGREITIPLGPNDTLTGNDLEASRDTYVTVGDVAATEKIASFLSVQKKEYDVRFGGDLSVGDLRERPAILIGGFNNSWTLEMTDNLRYIFAYDLEIQDRFDKQRRWKAPRDFTEDYAIISRVLDSKTGKILITAAGIGQAGTRAAGEFLTNADAIDSLMRGAPKGWEQKNMEIVLHTTVINNSPDKADVVATYYW